MLGARCAGEKQWHDGRREGAGTGAADCGGTDTCKLDARKMAGCVSTSTKKTSALASFPGAHMGSPWRFTFKKLTQLEGSRIAFTYSLLVRGL